MQAIERAAIESGDVTGLELMERAGRGVVDAILEEWPAAKSKWRSFLKLFKRSDPDPLRAVIFCGPGNNGGDGFVVARLLCELGWQTVVYFYGDPERLPPDARTNYDKWMKIGEVHPFTDQTSRDPNLYMPHPSVWIDAVFGIGQNRPLPELVTKMFHRVYYEQNWCTAPVVAVDIPSGLSSETGRSLQDFFLRADLTVTFHMLKLGHVTEDGPESCGKLVIKEIGL